MNSPADGQPVAFLYRWRIKPGKEIQFARAWTLGTEALHEHCGSFGSRLHRGSDGLWYGYALWPSMEARERGFAAGLVPDNYELMQDAVEESLPEVVLNPVIDRLVEVSLIDAASLPGGIAS